MASIVRLFIPLLVVCSVLLAQSAYAQFPIEHAITLQFGQHPGPSGALSFSLQVFHQVRVFDNITPRPTNFTLSATSPDTTEFENGDTHYRDTFPGLASLAFGVWTAQEKYADVDISYQFQVAPFDLSSMFTDVPIITSPTPGSTVPEQFGVAWTYQNGSMPSRRGFTIVDTQNVITRQLISQGTDPYSVMLNAPLAGPGPGSISGRAHTTTNLSDPTLIPPSPLTDDEFEISARFRSYSAVATYTVAPEPTAALLLAIGLMVPFRRRKFVSPQEVGQVAHRPATMRAGT